MIVAGKIWQCVYDKRDCTIQKFFAYCSAESLLKSGIQSPLKWNVEPTVAQSTKSTAFLNYPPGLRGVLPVIALFAVFTFVT